MNNSAKDSCLWDFGCNALIFLEYMLSNEITGAGGTYMLGF